MVRPIGLSLLYLRRSSTDTPIFLDHRILLDSKGSLPYCGPVQPSPRRVVLLHVRRKLSVRPKASSVLSERASAERAFCTERMPHTSPASLSMSSASRVLVSISHSLCPGADSPQPAVRSPSPPRVSIRCPSLPVSACLRSCIIAST